MSSEETLVVSRDATTRALLCSAFARQGLRARVALDSVAALELCRLRPPTTLILEPDTEGASLPELLSALRSNIRLRRIAVILLGSELSSDDSDRIASLPLPVYSKDVVSLSRFLSIDATHGVLPLGDYNVLSFVRALSFAQIQGQLLFRRPLPTKLPEAQVTISAGRVFCRAGHLQGKNALNRIAVWRRAQVIWRLETPQQEPPPEEIVEPIIFEEAAQYLAEVQSILAAMPPDDVPLVLVSEKKPPTAKVPGEVNTILNLCSLGLSLDAVLEEVPFRVLDSLRIIQRLFSLGILAKPTQTPIPVISGELSSTEPVSARPIVVLAQAPGEPEEDPMPSRSSWITPSVRETAMKDLEERITRTLEEDGDELDDPNISVSTFEEFETPIIQTPVVSRAKPSFLDEPLLQLEKEYQSHEHSISTYKSNEYQSQEYEGQEIQQNTNLDNSHHDTPAEGTPLSPKTRRWKLSTKKK
jgi:CheY-like chemotaxis protein